MQPLDYRRVDPNEKPPAPPRRPPTRWEKVLCVVSAVICLSNAMASPSLAHRDVGGTIYRMIYWAAGAYVLYFLIRFPTYRRKRRR
jgi:hypothetical protein